MLHFLPRLQLMTTINRNYSAKLYSSVKKSLPAKTIGKKKSNGKFVNSTKMQIPKKKSFTGNGASKGKRNVTGGISKKSSHKIIDCKSSSIVDKCDAFDTPKGNSKPFRLLSYCLLPFIMGFSGYVLTQHEEGDEKVHYFVPYEYMYKRLKRFAWGDGRKTFFHGPNNIIPEEEQYEKRPNKWEKEEAMRKILRDQHVKEELHKRQSRNNYEGK